MQTLPTLWPFSHHPLVRHNACAFSVCNIDKTHAYFIVYFPFTSTCQHDLLSLRGHSRIQISSSAPAEIEPLERIEISTAVSTKFDAFPVSIPM
uniref:Uncharacterized protein n=1 Tax=Parascaris univalens TaxID=6257 RepID=A0A915AVP1_PARUN